jgi:hypothetical protein
MSFDYLNEETQRYKFRIAVRRSTDYSVACNETFPKALRKCAAIVDALSCAAQAYVQLERPGGERLTFTFGNAAQHHRGINVLSALGLSTLALPAVQRSPGQMNAATIGIAALPFLAATTGPGRLYATRRDIGVHAALEFRIGEMQHRQLKDELLAISRKERHGVYCAPISNSATFATGFALAHGFDVPQPFWNTPRLLGIAIEKGREGVILTRQLTG